MKVMLKDRNLKKVKVIKMKEEMNEKKGSRKKEIQKKQIKNLCKIYKERKVIVNEKKKMNIRGDKRKGKEKYEDKINKRERQFTRNKGKSKLRIIIRQKI